MKRILFVMFIVLISAVPLADAHPFIDETVPTKSTNTRVGTDRVSIIYSEQIDIEFSSLKVFDSNGRQIDNRDTAYYLNEESLVVTTPPLEKGTYTVASKVLSKVDGHLVPDAFIFGVGDVIIPDIETAPKELIFYPEAGVRFPGLVGQTIVLGAVIASLLIWGTYKRDHTREAEPAYYAKFLSITGVGIIAVFASNILILIVQTLRLETSPIGVLETSFGTIWIIRMGMTGALLATWIVLEKSKKISTRLQIPMLIASLALISTTTMIGHGAASEQTAAIMLDYIHSLVAAVWIGGIIFFAFALLPSLSGLDKTYREKMSLVVIPKFSVMITASLGVVIISGPLLMWFLESNMELILDSTYGKLIIAKIAIALVMVGMGAYHQFGIQQKAEKNPGSVCVHKRLRRALGVESVLGIVLLGTVALLANGTLPAGEVQTADAQDLVRGWESVEFAENTQFFLQVYPFAVGSNTINVRVTDSQGETIPDLDAVKIKISNPKKSISPIRIDMTKTDGQVDEFAGNTTFGFAGNWLVEIEAQKTNTASEAVALDLRVKPRLVDLRTEITEYEMPDNARPLYLIHDGQTIWMSDKSQAALWRFLVDTEEFERIDFDGQASQMMTIDNDDKVWFTDIAEENIGYFDPGTGQTGIISLPQITPYTARSVPVALEADSDNNIWISIITKGVILRYDQQSQQFKEYRLPDQQAGPFDIIQDDVGTIWFTESSAGRIGTIDAQTGQIDHIPLDGLSSPEAFVFDESGDLWITEHSGAAITRYDTAFGTSEKVPVISPDSLPFGMAFDRYQNIWFAQHQIDSLGVYDPHNGDMIEVAIPTEGSFVQYITSDENQNIWFAEEGTGKIGMIRITDATPTGLTQKPDGQADIRYAEVASPLMALGIVAASVFFIKSVKDKRRLYEKILSD